MANALTVIFGTVRSGYYYTIYVFFLVYFTNYS